MALDWKTVKAEHIAKACDIVAGGGSFPKAGAKGIFIVRSGQKLPAKHVLRVAYCLANRMPVDSKVKFSSGEGTVGRLRGLGFDVDYVKVVPTANK
jgi:hypothetical protein